MQNLHLERRDWQNILDHISRAESSHKVTIEVDREDLGSQREVENVPLHGVSYDPKGDFDRHPGRGGGTHDCAA